MKTTPTDPAFEMTSVCAFCGHTGPRTAEEMAEHAMTCEKHPIAKLVHQNAILKHLLVETQVEAQRFTVWLLGHRQDKINLDRLPPMQDIPEDVQEEIIKVRKERYGIK